MEAAESSLFPGYRLDRYELLCPIASGGMASVWLARLRGKRGFEKLFAIKTIKTELISDPHYQQMFLDEARIASRIVHPNVAQILELGEENDILYLVMEWVDGDSLAKVHRLALKQGTPFPIPLCLRVVADICAGLHAAHQLKDGDGELLGVVHRDVSPQNVLLSTEGSAKVIDFGLVKAKGRTSAETETGIVKGKIRYMAPEQVGGRSSSVDHRADVWAAGMCLLELVTGKQPYPELDDLDVVKHLMSTEHPPLPDGLHPAVQSVISRAIVRDREGRFASCAQMKRAVDQAIAELGGPVDNDDVSIFVKENLPDLGTKRARTIARAIESADSRVPGDTGANGKYSVPVSPGSSSRTLDTESGEIAFAATEVSGRHSPDYDDAAMPLTRQLRTGIDPNDPPEQLESDSDRSISNLGASHSTGGSLLRDQLAESKGRRSNIGFWIAAGVVAIAAAWVLWPRSGPKAVAADPVTLIDAAPPTSATVAEVQPPPSAPAAVDLELPPATPVVDAGSPGKKLTWPSGATPSTSGKTATPVAEVDAGAKKKYNPAYSILTNPPPGVLSGEPEAPKPPPPPPAPAP